MRRGALTAFVSSHRLPWELVMAALTLVVVAASLVVDAGGSELVTTVVAVLAVIFLAEFASRCWDSKSRFAYLREHWIDLITCLPFIGPLRLLRLLRLLGLLRLAHEIRDIAYVRAEVAGESSSLTWIVWPPALLLWLGPAAGLRSVERGHNPA